METAAPLAINNRGNNRGNSRGDNEDLNSKNDKDKAIPLLPVVTMYSIIKGKDLTTMLIIITIMLITIITMLIITTMLITIITTTTD